MLAKTFLLLATLALASAGPVKRQSGCSSKPVNPTLPTNGNGTYLLHLQPHFEAITTYTIN